MSNALIDSDVDLLAQTHARRIVSESHAAADYTDRLKIDLSSAYFPSDTTSDTVRYVDFASPPPRKEILDRIEQLREIAEDDSIIFSDASCSDMLEFLKTRPGARNPNIFLLDNGNLRTVWKCAEGRQIGLQFCGKGKVQFVLFSRRPTSEYPIRAAGWDDLSGVGKQIVSFDLMGLLYQ